MNAIRHLLQMTKKVYRERGLKNLLIRIKDYLSDLSDIFLVGSGDVLYVSGCPGGSRFYRCENQAKELKLYGLKPVIVSQGIQGLNLLVKKFDVFIFQRPIVNEYLGNVIEKLEEQGKMIIFETDDLVFDPQYIPFLHYYNFFGEEEKTWYDNGIGREVLENKYVKNCVVSTEFLAKKLKEKYPDKTVFVSENKLNEDQVEKSRNALSKISSLKARDGKVRIGYFSGSKSHNNDFETVSDVLVEVLKENKKAVLMIVGHLDLGEKFKEVDDQIEKYDFVPMKKYLEVVLKADINIAPLEIDNPFCQAKSVLKYFESGVLRIPTIATATEPFIKAIRNGKNGFVAHNSKEWKEYLKLLIENETLRSEIGHVAQKDCLDNYAVNAEKLNNDFMLFLKKEVESIKKNRIKTKK